MPGAGKADLDPVMDQALAPQPFAEAGLDQEIDAALLQHAGTDAALDMLAAALLEDDGVDPLALQQVAQQQAGRPGAEYADLGALLHR